MKSDRLDVFPERFGVDSSDPDLIQKHLDQTYSARFAISRPDPAACALAHARIDVGSYAIEDIRHAGEVLLRADRIPSAVALFVVSGRVEVEHGKLTGAAGPGQWVLASSGVGGVRIRLREAHLRSVVVARPLLTEVAAIDTAAAAVPRFTGLVPVDVGAARTLGTTERFLHRLLGEQDGADNRILLASAGRLLASALLTTFPNDLPPEDAPEDAETLPVLLRQAIEFIQDNAAHDIGVSDVAAALYLSPRTVQYMFRRHLDTTPTAYLRDIRLARAREELIASDRSVTTVAATAARWGFAHTGRFAVIYRRTFGESPHETLRR